MTIQVTESFQTTTTLTRQLPLNGSTRNSNIDNRLLHNAQGVLGRNNPLFLFGKDNDEEKERGDREKKRSKIPFFGRRSKSKEGEDEPQKIPEPTTVAAATPRGMRPPKAKKKESPSADDLRLMAERARLEAERLDAELTLSKIEKLEQQLLKSKKESGDDSAAVVEDLQRQLDALQAKLRGEPVQAEKVAAAASTYTAAAATVAAAAAAAEATTMSEGEEPVIRVPVVKQEVEVARTGVVDEIDNAKFLEVAEILAKKQAEIFTFVTNSEKDIEFLPEMIVKLVAPFYGLKAGPGEKVDREELIRRGKMIQELDYSFFDSIEPPSFDKSDIRQKKLFILNNEERIRDLSEVGIESDLACVTQKMIEKADGDASQLALYSLEYDYYVLSSIEDSVDDVVESIVDNMLGGAANQTFMTTMYPKCVVNRGENKGDDYVSEEPTDAQIDVLTKSILPVVKFSTSSKPRKVAGGYIITGSHKYKDGDALIEAIDNEIAKSRPNLKDQLTVLYTPSYGPTDDSSLNLDEINDFTDMLELAEYSDLSDFQSEPILFITGPNIVRDANRVALTLTSIIGLATSWYLSVYPFLLNDKIASRIDADLQLVEANLQPDLSYLTDLSIPLFLCFMGIQLVHEAAHRLTAMSKDVKLSVPVFVPSLITGITSAVTTFKTLPKNKNDMFDISASGPLAGVVVSSVALALGAKLTLISDPATLPALPLNILRQSTLGGAIIDNVITGSLYVPEGAPMAGLTIPLHPIAIAGYVGLIVNALALLPIGSKSLAMSLSAFVSI